MKERGAADNLVAEQPLDVGEEPRDVDLGDVNGDGLLDAVVLRRVAARATADVLPLLNNGAGSFSLGAPADAGGPALSLSLGDFESGNTCTDLSNNSMHCGLCGAECALDEFCQNGQCVLKADIDDSNSIDLSDFWYFQSVFGGPE